MDIIQTFGYRFLSNPRRVREEKALECDLDVRMVLPDPVEDSCGLFEWHDDEQMLGLGTPAHGEG